MTQLSPSCFFQEGQRSAANFASKLQTDLASVDFQRALADFHRFGSCLPSGYVKIAIENGHL
jgi:hypothetical protein